MLLSLSWDLDLVNLIYLSKNVSLDSYRLLNSSLSISLQWVGLSSHLKLLISAKSFALITFAEFFCALFVLLGVGTRIFTIPLIYAFIIIVFDAHIDDPFSKMEKGFLFLVSYSSIFLLGPGKFSIDYLLSKKLKL